MLIVVRHGQTVHNAGRRLSGRADVALDEVGERQAEAVATCLDSVDRIVSSPLGRARATAAAIAERTGAPVRVDDRWIELDYGEWDGRPLADVPAETWAAWIADPSFRPPGGETLVELGERVATACADLAEEATEHDVVVVTHVSPIKAAVAWALAGDERLSWRLHVATASITRVGVGPRGPVLQSFNETMHLPR